MALDVGSALKNPGQVFSFTEAVKLPGMDILGDPVRFEGVAVTGEYFCTGDNRISLRANVEAVVHTRCSRCLEPVQEALRADIDALYAKQPDPEDPDLYTFEAHALALEDAAKDALLLALPLQFLCKPDCRGLCPVCGGNLNRNTCTCQEGNVVTGPFSALKDYVLGTVDK